MYLFYLNKDADAPRAGAAALAKKRSTLLRVASRGV